MAAANPQATPGAKPPVFAAACWLLGLMAFAQLLVAGLALVTRFEQSREVRVVEKEVFKPVVVRVPAPAPAAVAAPVPVMPSEVVSRPPPAAPPAVAPAIQPVAPTPLTVPNIADSRSERLVAEARQARVAGDMGSAIVKLEEALTKSPDEAAVYYELGLVYEQMGVIDKAGSNYEKVFQMGVAGAGALYEMAAAKLRDGFEQPADMLDKLSLGRVRVFNESQHAGGQQVILTIPVQKGPAEQIDDSQIGVSVLFFNRTTKGEILLLGDESWATEQWTSLPFDWAGGEESLRLTYTIPPQDSQTEQLFGGRSYYGYAVLLKYKGEVLDVQACPRHLVARIPQKEMPRPGAGQEALPELQDLPPPDFDPNAPLLPPLPAR